MNKTPTAAEAREALAFFAPKGAIYTAARAGWVCAHRETLEAFIAAHDTVSPDTTQPGSGQGEG
jgi:hypothetical protein